MAKSISFEEAMLKLEDSVAKLENGNLSLDDSITEFENCVKLIKLCDEKLTVAKQKVRILIEGEDSSVSDRPFSSEDET